MWESDGSFVDGVEFSPPSYVWVPEAGILSWKEYCCWMRDQLQIPPTLTPATPDELQMLVDAGLDLSMFDV